MSLERRAFLSAVAGLPFLKFTASAQKQQITSQKAIGIQMLRAINTAQHWHHSHENGFLARTELPKTKAWAALGEDEHAEKRGIGKTLQGSMDLSSSAIAPNWSLFIGLGENKDTYVALLRFESPEERVHLVTDERGIIYDANEISGLLSKGSCQLG